MIAWVAAVAVVALACALCFELGRTRGFWQGLRVRERVARYNALHPLVGEATGEGAGDGEA